MFPGDAPRTGAIAGAPEGTCPKLDSFQGKLLRPSPEASIASRAKGRPPHAGPSLLPPEIRYRASRPSLSHSPRDEVTASFADIDSSARKYCILAPRRTPISSRSIAVAIGGVKWHADSWLLRRRRCLLDCYGFATVLPKSGATARNSVSENSTSCACMDPRKTLSTALRC